VVKYLAGDGGAYVGGGRGFVSQPNRISILPVVAAWISVQLAGHAKIVVGFALLS
jgi:hypothetical protein